jgi:CubicO group peptidase (beta-lactamase class C family)
MQLSDRCSPLMLLLTLVLPSTAVAQKADSVAQRRHAVERSLTPAIVLEGQAVPRWTMQERMVRYNVPGVSLAVIRNGSIEWSAAYGSTGGTSAQPVTSTTLFQAASLSKPVAALLALTLVQEGRLSLGENVDHYLRTWRLPASSFTATHPITLSGLLSHSAGVTVSGFAGYPQGAPRPTLVQILEGTGPANSPRVLVDTIPGTRYRYSGGGYQIAQLVMEDVTGTPIADLARDLVLTPLDMEHSTFAELSPAQARTTAAGHSYNGAPVAGNWHRYPEQAAAGLWSTAGEMAKLVVGLIESAQGAEGAVLDRSLMAQMLTRQIGSAGLGLGVHGDGDDLLFDHAGVNEGYRAYMAGYPVTGNGVVVMTNGDGGTDLINEIVRSVSHVYGWSDFAPDTQAVAPVPRPGLARYAGTYRVAEEELIITVRAEADHLVVSTPRGSHYTFYPVSMLRFVAIEDGSTIEIVQRRDEPTELRLWGMRARRTSQAW